MDHTSQTILFKIWKYGLTLPEFDFDYSERVFKYKKSYVRFFNFIILFLLYLVLLISNRAILTSNVITFVATFYKFILFFNTCYSTLVIYSAVGIIEKMSRNLRTITTLQKDLGPYRNTKRKRNEVLWLIYIGVLYFSMFVCDYFLATMDMGFKLEIVIYHIFYVIDIEFQQLLITFNCFIAIYFQQLNQYLESINRRTDDLTDFELVMDESKMAAKDFMSVSSHLILIKCFYVSCSIIVCLFMNMEYANLKISVLTCALSYASNILWFCIEVSKIIFAVHQYVAICEEVRCHTF